MNVIISLSTANLEVINFDILNKIYNLYKGNLHSLTLLGELYSAKGYKKYADELVLAFSPNLIITIPEEGQYLTFEDSTLELKLITNFSSDGFGVSYGDAGTAILGTTFKDDTNITSFNEFKYFTKANTTPSNEMFRGCTNLTEIDLSEVTTFSWREFSGSGLTTVNAPNALTISNYTFAECESLISVIDLGHILTITLDAFSYCNNLESVNLPDECIILGNYAIGFPANAQNMGSLLSISGINHVLQFGYRCLCRQNKLILEASDLAAALIIGNEAFWYVKVKGINCPNLISLGESAFRENPVLTSIECLGKISRIPGSCFNEDTALQTVKIPYECTSIGGNAFYGCSSLTSITLYNKSLNDYAEGESPTFTNISRITLFGQSCFEGCSLLNLTPQDIQNATTIDNGAFRGVSSLSGTLNLPNLTGTLGTNAFVNTNISSILSLGNVTTIGDNAFNNTNISSITIPNSVKTCSSTIVSNTSVSEIIFPEGVELITGGLFYTKNNSLIYIEIPSTVTNMGKFFHRSLENSTNDLCTLIIKATTPPELNYYSDGSGPKPNHTRGEKFAGIYVPDTSLTAYQNAANAWQHSSIQAKLKPISQLQTDNPTAWAKYNRV